MGFARVYSRAVVGVESPLVQVEVHIGPGLPRFTIVGLPATAVKESKDRVRSAIANSGFRVPDGHITVNLAPADLPKHGAGFDLPVAIGILSASGALDNPPLASTEFTGELALDGSLRRTGGALASSLQISRTDRAFILPAEDATEAALVKDTVAYGAKHLLEVCDHLSGLRPLMRESASVSNYHRRGLEDLADVRGQARARRAIEIAAAGEHHLLLIGPPGTGKSMLALRLSSVLPEPSERESLETAAVASAARLPFNAQTYRHRPFRAPHHTASTAALVGGGSKPRPGEVSLAHNGVLFLDEFPEFDRRVVEALREPLERRTITVSRAEFKTEFPANFQLITAMNPCPCGYQGDASGRCRCSPDRVERYVSKVSGPLLDRIDLHVETRRPRADEAPSAQSDLAQGESSAAVRARVVAARTRQQVRQQTSNGQLSSRDTQIHGRLNARQVQMLESSIEQLGLSMRARDRVLRVALTIADLAGQARIQDEHLREALSFRLLDRAYGQDGRDAAYAHASRSTTPSP